MVRHSRSHIKPPDSSLSTTMDLSSTPTAGSVKQPYSFKPPHLIIRDNGPRPGMLDTCYSPMLAEEALFPLSPMSPFLQHSLLSNVTPTLFSPLNDNEVLLELSQLDLLPSLAQESLPEWMPLSPTTPLSSHLSPALTPSSPMLDLSQLLTAGQTPNLGIDIPYFSPSFEVSNAFSSTPDPAPDTPLSLHINTQLWPSTESASSPFLDSTTDTHSFFAEPISPSPTSPSFDATFRIFSPRKMVKEGQPGIPTDEKPFACEHCPVSFSRKHDLKRHARIHLGIRPYGCKICGKTFSRMDALGRHTEDRGCKSLKKMRKTQR